MSSNISSVVKAWSVNCVEDSENSYSILSVDSGSLLFRNANGDLIIQSGNLDGNLYPSFDNLFGGQWGFEYSPIIPDSELDSSAASVRRVKGLIADSLSDLTLQAAYDAFTCDLDGVPNGFRGDIPTEFRVGNASVKISDGNVTLQIRDELNDWVKGGIDITGGTVSFSGKVNVPDTNEASPGNAAVNIRRLRHEIESLLSEQITWTGSNTFAHPVALLSDPVTELDATSKKYVDSTVKEYFDSLRNFYSEENPALNPVDGVVTWVINHKLDSKNIVSEVLLVSDSSVVFVDKKYLNDNEIEVKFNSGATVPAGTYSIKVVKGV